MDLFNLFGKITLDNSDYKKKVDETKQKNEELAENTKKSSAKSVIAWAAIGAAVIAVANSIKNLIIDTANYADQIGDLAQKWGFSTQEIQEFDYWATMNGTTLESLMTGMRGLVNQADAGASAFNKLGLSVRNADGTLKEQKSLFLETIDALQKIENQTERNALQFEIFGRAGIELGQVINKSADELNALSQEAEDLGIILSDKAVERAGEFNDELDKIRLSWKSVIAELIAGTEDAEENFDKFMDNIVETLNELAPVIAEVGGRLGEILGNALLETFKNTFLKMIGKGWLWGEGSWFGWGDNSSTNVSTTENQISTITNTAMLERTEKVEETLEISLKVESDGTTASKENLDIVSDLVVDKINKILGGEV